MLSKKRYDFDLIVIGTGAGGSVGAHHAAETLGKRVAVFEKGTIGGECPNYACVPTKALLHVAHIYNEVKNSHRFGIDAEHAKLDFGRVHSYKNMVVGRTGASHGEESFKHEHITLIREKAKFISPHEVEAAGKIYSANKFLIATGSKPAIPPIEGVEEAGYLTFKEAINLDRLPESLFVMGGGAVACELSQAFSQFGTNITIAIRSDKILNREDLEVQELIGALFENSGIKILNNTTVEKVEKDGGKKRITYKKGSETHTVTVDDILIATGKHSVLDFDPEKAGIKIVDHKIVTNRFLQTSAPNIFIAGDIAGPYLFTHTGYYQSYIATHNAFSHIKTRPDYSIIPRCVFIEPEVASVGKSEKEVIEKKIRYKVGIAPIALLGRANTSSQMDGFVKLIVNYEDEVIGGSIVAPTAGEMIHQIALAIKFRATAYDLANMITAYPTFSEGIKLAASNIQ